MTFIEYTTEAETMMSNEAIHSNGIEAGTSNPGLAAVDSVFDAITAEQLAEIFKASGYRVTAAEQNGVVQLMSASQGVGFVVRFGNVATPGTVQTTGDAPAYLDYTLSCALQVQGDLPADLVPSWNRTKRFARLAAHAQFLVLELDVVVAGGVATAHLRSMIELWDRLLQEFLLHLRNRPAMAAADAAAVDTGSESGFQVHNAGTTTQ
ncbi:YbjN domain-containing protein [Paraburkholderia acidicola]|uniref:YbjN domain-containing protein n=2 Tax=Paraburkholderia acidicola TaxID=1912599 RepID=A0ABV1LU38_9BURK